MNTRFRLIHILTLTLFVALLIPYFVATLRASPTLERFEVFDLAVQRALAATDPTALVLGSGSSGNSQSNYAIDNELFIATELEDSAAVFEHLLGFLDRKIAAEKWLVVRSEGARDSHWFRLEKGDTVCIFQVWVVEPTDEQLQRLSHLETNRYVVKTASFGFCTADSLAKNR
ncbi:MAG TPA: hypothetical protein DDW52_18415 [Planctomycetaceae bacterium]|nr:hypothetical protein [Planctomycetaceae bacterium]